MNKKNEIEEPLVSIIMPAYNSERYISEAINSVLMQSYKNWELLIIDDCSRDSTGNIANNMALTDHRIKYCKLENNSGPAVARNKGIDLANGKYIAFLDSDDTWYYNKLKFQINSMEKKKQYFSCTDYEKIDEEGNSLHKTVKCKKISDYKSLLKKCPGNSTVIYNANKLGKFYISNIRKRNDYLMWLQIVKESELIGFSKVLSTHRIQRNGISRNKVSLIKYHWRIYRDHESLNIFYSVFLILYWVTKPLGNFFKTQN